MEQTSISSGWKIALVGGCATLALCGAAILVGMFVFAMSAPAQQQPVYSDSQPSYESAPQQEPVSVPQGTIRPDLVGHWRYTDILMSGDFTLVTDYHIIFSQDGRCATYYQGDDGQVQDYLEAGWSATDTVIELHGDDGSTASLGYQIMNGYLIIEGNTSRPWERISP